ncbi:YbhB/YbcL family Raf kinase inhibitor-like protein, partial [Sphaerotilus sp.]|uniref:YbhB/YbcL family Raf kinase inhibitor-like protein n=1 Tax=Sphaerotilus sp. TaxID=2093942 RepID=UPI0034E2FA9E
MPSLSKPASSFTLSSPDIAEGSTIANKFVLNGFGCKGENVSPALVWTNPPAGTKSYAVQVYDPDAPTGSGFWHWGVYDIPASVTSLVQGAGNSLARLPGGAHGGLTDFHDTGATGANGN